MGKEFKFTKTIEDMSNEDLIKRIKDGYEHKMPEIKAIPYIGIEQEVTYEYPELTALCPMTGIQDLYTINIEFTPNKLIPELKSLKQYFLAFRDLPISHEYLNSKITEEFKKAVKPKELCVALDVAVRGGIKTTVMRIE